MPKADTPKEIAIDITFPEPKQVCEEVSIEVTETACGDSAEERRGKTYKDQKCKLFHRTS